MGRILAAEDSSEDARQHLETALTHDPNNLAIQRAMEGLEGEDKPADKNKGGLFARFRRKKGDDA